ncbi:YebG family protein [Marinomonas ostreistagni]|uniref:YebG family protein n=1 Tax=Marinomonas ostreistagni TaxID=359209 RepID=A0ABS0Z8D3_9GAMM|nr:YebG family protein [Marinomonas ostreistagni]
MPVVIKYVVERNGVEKMTFSSKAEADHYDKLLETAENLEDLLQESGTLSDANDIAQLAMYLAENKEDVLEALGNKRKKATKKTPPKTETSSPKKESKEPNDTETVQVDDLVIEPDEESYIEDSDEYRSNDEVDYNKDEIYNESDAA